MKPSLGLSEGFIYLKHNQQMPYLCTKISICQEFLLLITELREPG